MSDGVYFSPMPQPEIIGHKKQLLQLEEDLATGNLSHAYLFTGPAHIGKTTVARWFARKILLKDAAPENYDQVAHAVDHLFHQDILMLDQLWMEEKMEDWDVIAKSSNIPQQHRAKAGLKTDSISVDDVREIQNRLYDTGELAHRVAIIRGVERMQDSAANAFLKILEEPPPGRVFILTTDAPSSVLSTIHSRSRVLSFERVGLRDMQDLLPDLAPSDASFILHVSQGAPGLALALRDDPDLLREERLLHTHAIACWEASTLHERLTLLKPLLERGAESERFLFHLALALRDHPTSVRSQERALQQLSEALETNAMRALQVQEFAMSV
jgi:DNA polymerase III subunit delta'